MPIRASRSPIRSLLLALAALWAPLTGCVPSEAADSGRIEDLPVLTAAVGLRIGSVDDPNTGFSRLASLDVDADGNLFVLESSVPEIRVYSPTGALLRRFGRRGAGPGEFESAGPFGVMGDTVWAVDSRHRRITTFDRRGEVISTAPIEEAGVQLTNGTAFPYPERTRSDGTLIGKLSLLRYGGGDPGLVSGPTDLIPVPLVRFSLAGEVIDTLGWAVRPPPVLWRPAAEEPEDPGHIEAGGQRHFLPSPPSTLPEYLQLAEGYVLVDRPLAGGEQEGAVTITRFGLEGDTVYRRELRYTPSRYSDAELDRIASDATRGIGLRFAPEGSSGPAIENPGAVTNRLRAAMDFPEFQMPIEATWAANDGSVWLAYRPATADSITWIILDPAGEPRGLLELPARVRLLWHRGDVFFASVPDELDVPWLVRYTLAPA